MAGTEAVCGALLMAASIIVLLVLVALHGRAACGGCGLRPCGCGRPPACAACDGFEAAPPGDARFVGGAPAIDGFAVAGGGGCGGLRPAGADYDGRHAYGVPGASNLLNHGRRGTIACAEPPLEPPDGVAGLGSLRYTDEVGRLVTGQLYEASAQMRPVYSERTAEGGAYGLTEFSSAGGAGDVGVDVGPYGLAEYGGRQVGYDDGIPAAWAFPSTPVRWYAPAQRDYYGPEGPTAYTTGLTTMREPDHDPAMP